MKSTLIAATIVALALTATLASPAFASKNDGRFAMSPEQHAQACKKAYDSYMYNGTKGYLASQDGKGVNSYTKEADKQLAIGQSLGCSWAS
jgi:hypothetical protein